MAESTQIGIVRRLYDARGNPDIIRQVLAPDVRWEVVEGFPYGGVYVGLDDVFHRPICSCVDSAKRQDRGIAAVRRYGVGYSSNDPIDSGGGAWS